MSIFKLLVMATLVLCLAACNKSTPGDKPVTKVSGNSVYVDIGNLSEFKDVAKALSDELEKLQGIKLAKDNKEATFHLSINAMVPEETNAATNNNYIILSYTIVNFDNRNTTHGLGMGQRNLLQPFAANVAEVLNTFINRKDISPVKNRQQ